MRRGLGLLRQIFTVGQLETYKRDCALSSGCEQMVADPTHIDGGVLDLVATDIPDVVEVRFG